MKLRAVGYCRTSGEAQRDNTSIPVQRQAIERFCERNEWKCSKHYIDESKTGSKIDGREQFQQMLKDAALEKFDLIVVFDADRFARDGVDILGQAKFLKQLGVYVLDTKGQFDSRPGANVVMNYVKAGISEQERISILDRTIRGRIEKAKQGLPWSGNVPYGREFKSTGKNTGEWSISQRGVRLAALLERYAAGERMKEVLQDFPEFGRSEIVFHAVRHGQLSAQPYVKVFNIPDLNITNERIAIPSIPAVITADLEKRVRDRMDHCRTWTKESLKHYLLSGFLRCGHCQYALTGGTANNGHDHRYTYYRHNAGSKRGCVIKGVREEVLEPVIDSLYRFFIDEPSFNAAVAAALPSADERSKLEKQRDAAQRQVTQIERQINRLVEAIMNGADSSLLVSKQKELTATKEAATELQMEAEHKLAAMPDLATVERDSKLVRDYLLTKVRKRNWRKLPFEEVRRFLAFLFGENPGKTGDGITVKLEKGRYHFSFKGRVTFYHDVVDGKPHFHVVTKEAARLNQSTLRFYRELSSKEFES